MTIHHPHISPVGRSVARAMAQTVHDYRQAVRRLRWWTRTALGPLGRFPVARAVCRRRWLSAVRDADVATYRIERLVATLRAAGRDGAADWLESDARAEGRTDG